MRTSVLIIASLALHVGGFAFISTKTKQVEKRQTLIAMVEQKKKEEEKKKEPPPKPIEAPKEVLQPKSLAPPPPVAEQPTEPVVNEAPSKAMQALPDYGLNLSSGSGGGTSGGSLAVGDGKRGGAPGGTGTAPPKPTEKVLNKAPPNGTSLDLAAEIAAWKPRPTARVKPVYPDEARSSEIEGTVTVEAIIDCSGKVTSARVLTGLGHGLDQAAITAIQKTEFEPAPRCVPGFQKAMKINYAFRLGD